MPKPGRITPDLRLPALLPHPLPQTLPILWALGGSIAPLVASSDYQVGGIDFG